MIAGSPPVLRIGDVESIVLKLGEFIAGFYLLPAHVGNRASRSIPSIAVGSRGYVRRNGAIFCILLCPDALFSAVSNLLRGVALNAVCGLLAAGELRAIIYKVLRRPVCDLFSNGRLAIARVGVITEELWAAPSTLLFKLLEEVSHGLGVVACFVGNDGAASIGLRFIFAGVLEGYDAGA